MSAKTTWILVLVLLAAFVFWLVRTPGKPGRLDAFASCVKDSGALFYGAFWCPHCQNQKAMFGSSAKLLPYIECSTPDGKNQLPICNTAGIESYPTWTFADGTTETGAIPLVTLAEKTQCALPE